MHPQALIEDLRAAKARRAASAQLDLFGDFNGMRRIRREASTSTSTTQNWSNRMILGDSLLVMTSLAEKEGLKGKVQMIYIDPPYGIKFGSNWQVEHAQAGREGRQGRGRRRASRSRSGRSATPGSWASTPTSRTCAIGSVWRGNC